MFVDGPHPSPLGWAEESRAVGPNRNGHVVAMPARIRPTSDGGGGAEDGAARVAGGAGRALRHPPAPRLPRGIMTTPCPSANGASSLSPGQRPGSACRNAQRPVGPRYGRRNAPAYSAPLGRVNRLMARDPARWAGLRNHGPFARNTIGTSCANNPTPPCRNHCPAS